MARKKKRELPNERHELFCHYFVFGHPKHDPENPSEPPAETLRNAKESYMAAGYVATDRAAITGGSRLLTRVDCQNRIVELRKHRDRIKAAFTESWKSMLPEAQEILRPANR